MKTNQERIIKAMLTALIVGVWTFTLRPSGSSSSAQAQQPKLAVAKASGEVGHYQMMMGKDNLYVLDTKTGVIKLLQGKSYTGTWEKGYEELEKTHEPELIPSR